jgi:crotonobetainyl-CoA:carnitine CoA-transferase CaiB-like acyl-CoA transferase
MAALPLDGMRVLDLTRLLPGNYCCWLLASLGAEVTKVEDPAAGDYMRVIGRMVDGQSGTHHLVNRGKRSIVIDLKSPAGRETFLKLVEQSDAVVESFRSGVMERLGVGPDVLRERNPSIVIASISGYGATGPLSGVAAHDINALAFAGLMTQMTRNQAGVPEPLTTPLADLIGGGFVPAIGVLALLLQAQRTDKGGWLDASLAEGAALLPSVLAGDVLSGGPVPAPGTPEWAGSAFYRVYHLVDGQVAVGAVEPQFWRGLCEALGLPELIDAHAEEERQPEVERILAERFATMTRAEFLELTAGRDTCANLVQDTWEMATSDHARARELVRPAVDVPMQVLAPPFRIDGARPPETLGAPKQGEHTHAVLRDAGFSDDEIANLVETGAIGLAEERPA